MQTPSTNQLLTIARELRAKCKEHQWDDLRRQIDALMELESRDHLIAGLDMIQTAYACRLEALISKQDDRIEAMDKKLSTLYQDADIFGTRTPSKAALRLMDHIREELAPSKKSPKEVWEDMHASFTVTHSAANTKAFKELLDGFVKRQDALHSALSRFAQKLRLANDIREGVITRRDFQDEHARHAPHDSTSQCNHPFAKCPPMPTSAPPANSPQPEELHPHQTSPKTTAQPTQGDVGVTSLPVRPWQAVPDSLKASESERSEYRAWSSQFDTPPSKTPQCGTESRAAKRPAIPSADASDILSANPLPLAISTSQSFFFSPHHPTPFINPTHYPATAR
jgi:hypothetical protein